MRRLAVESSDSFWNFDHDAYDHTEPNRLTDGLEKALMPLSKMAFRCMRSQ